MYSRVNLYDVAWCDHGNSTGVKFLRVLHSALRARNRTGAKNRTGPVVGCDWGKTLCKYQSKNTTTTTTKEICSLATCSDNIVHISRVTRVHNFSYDMLWWWFKQEWKNNCEHSHFNQNQIAASTILIQPVPFSSRRYRYLAYILMSKYLLFKFALPFSLARTYKRIIQSCRGLPGLCRYSETLTTQFLGVDQGPRPSWWINFNPSMRQ